MLSREQQGYDIEKLRAHIEKRRANIRIYEGVIAGERAAIERETEILRQLEQGCAGQK